MRIITFVTSFLVLLVSARQGVVVFADSRISRCVHSDSANSVVDLESHRINCQLPTFATMPSSALGMKQLKTLRVHLCPHRVALFSQCLLGKGRNLFMFLTTCTLILKFGE